MVSEGKKSARPVWEQLKLDLAAEVTAPKSPGLQMKTLVTANNTDIDPAELLKESESRYRILFENSADGISLMTDIFYDCNARFGKIMGRQRKEIIGRSPVEMSPPQQPNGRNSAEYAAELIKAGLDGTPQYFYWQHQRQDGVLIDTEVSLNAVTIGGRKFLQTTLRDITERRRVEEALRKSEARYRSLANSLPEVI